MTESAHIAIIPAPFATCTEYHSAVRVARRTYWESLEYAPETPGDDWDLDLDRLMAAEPSVDNRLAQRCLEQGENADVARSALERFLAEGVVVGEPVDADTDGCSSCTWHLCDAEGVALDGGNLLALRSWVDEGYLRGGVTLHPVR